MSEHSHSTEFSHGQLPTLGVLLVNLGTPNAPTAAALRKYLAEFLWDPRVVEFPRVLWWLALHGVILRLRPARSAHSYKQIWTAEGSPLLTYSQKQQKKLQHMLSEKYVDRMHVVLAMRYGKPSIDQALQQLFSVNARRILVLPLYPQYSATTTASVMDAVSLFFKTQRWVPELRYVTHYGAHKAYINSCVQRIQKHWQQHEKGQLLLFSFHGIPQRYWLKGDPYHCQCHETARLIASALELHEDQWQVCFQSRFGREQWLQPYTDHVLQQLPSKNIHAVDVFCPGFAADCLETLEEINMQNRQLFLAVGGRSFNYISALNDSDEHIAALAEIILEHCQGWPETSPVYSSTEVQRNAEDAKQRARAMGAKN